MDEAEKISLELNYEYTNGTIVHSYVDGELESATHVVLNFDFSNTDSVNPLSLFGIELVEREETITVDALAESIVSVEFSSHGMYTLKAFAIDNQGVKETTEILVRMELRMEWFESNTYEPISLVIDPIPIHGGASPDTIHIHSTVENPELIAGREVEFTWSLVDGNEDACQVRNGLVHDGEFVDWETIHFNTFQVHELKIDYDSGQDYINIDHSVLIAYSEIESTPTLTND
tara:strand:- start:1360 stop:2055 length:696 start_codon:yes stop_codon:yes gene_type:complete